MQLSSAQIAYIAFLKETGQSVVHMSGDDGWDELYIITSGYAASFVVHTLVNKGRDLPQIEMFGTLAAAMTFSVNQACHTWLLAAEQAAPMQTYTECHRSKDEAALAREIGAGLTCNNMPREVAA